MKFKSQCGCDDDILCKEGKRLWKLKGFRNRKRYSYHRMSALNLLNEQGIPDCGVESIRSNYE